MRIPKWNPHHCKYSCIQFKHLKNVRKIVERSIYLKQISRAWSVLHAQYQAFYYLFNLQLCNYIIYGGNYAHLMTLWSNINCFLYLFHCLLVIVYKDNINNRVHIYYGRRGKLRSLIVNELVIYAPTAVVIRKWYFT